MPSNSRWNGMKPLLGREYANARLFIFAVPIVYFLIVVLKRMNNWLWNRPSADTLARLARHDFAHGDLYRYVYDNGANETGGRLWLLLAVFVLALVQLGVERRNGSQELLFSLPYSRARVFLCKWLLGAMMVTGTLLTCTLADVVVMAVSPASDYVRLDYFAVQFGYSWLVVLAGYACALLVGAVTGSVASQTILTWVLAAFPIGFFLLLDASLNVQGIQLPRRAHDGLGNSYTPLLGDRIQDALNFIGYASLPYTDIVWWRALAMLVLLGAGLLLVTGAYVRNRVENNGKLMLFKGGETVLRYAVVLCASMIAGMVGKGLFRLGAGERLGYDIGFVLGCVLSAFIIRKLLRMRFKY